MQRMLRDFFLAGTVLVALSSAQAATVTLRPVADTTLFETSPDGNMGATRTLVVGTTAKDKKSRALLRFDIPASLPAGSMVTSAVLRFQVTKAPPGRVDSRFDIHRLLVPWGEGNKSDITGRTASPGEASWRARIAPTSLWSVPGAGLGTDYSGSISGSVAVSGLGTYMAASTSNLVADAQLWLDNPATNHGWIIISQAEGAIETARRIASREEAGNAPTLILEFLPPEIRLTSIVRGQTNATIHWTGGLPPYQLQAKTSLSQTNWTNLGTPVQTNQAEVPITGSSAFFRLSNP